MKLPPNSGGSHDFSRVPSATIQRSQFNRSHGYKTTFDAGYLIPIFLDEILPGDTMRLDMTGFARMATPVKPLMDNLYFDTHFFFVPYRLVWDNFEKFMGAQTNPGDSTNFLVPQLAAHNPTTDLIGQYFGLPQVNVNTMTVNALFHRSYNAIFNTWYRDQNQQNSLNVHTDDGPDPMASYDIRRRGKRHDYFTSALPWPQKGNAVGMPAVYVVPNTSGGVPLGPTFRNSADVAQDKNILAQSTSSGGAVIFGGGSGSWTANDQARWDNPNLYADLGSLTVNQIRTAFQLQRWEETDARGGTRYIEKIRAHFGVTSPDARLQRPEYLGGGSSPVTINSVAQTQRSDVAPATPQGNLAGVGTMTANRHGFAKSFVEHGCVIGLASVRADLSYQQGIPRMFTRRTVLDFPWPTFAHLGEQSILSKEIYWDGTAGDDTVFGYQERYAEMRYKPSLITGKLSSLNGDTLDVWHLGQKFGSRPVLGNLFIEEQPPMSRVIAVPTEPHFILDSYFHYICARPLPVFGVPGLVDHF